MHPRLVDRVMEWMRIPSISTGGGDPSEIRRAATWAVDLICKSRGKAELVHIGSANPLVVGEFNAVDSNAPTILIYGHYDVQGPGSPELWSSPPFEPEIREGRIYGRGAADDKGNFAPLLYAACAMSDAGELPVNVRVLVEGEEELGSAAAISWVRADERGADAAVVFDSGMPDKGIPAITVGLRGIVMTHVEVRTAAYNLHSGLYGGSVLNALHVLHGMLAGVLPGRDGRPPAELREGAVAPTDAAVASWKYLPAGEDIIASAGGRLVHGDAGTEYYRRNGFEASLDVTEIVGGESRTIVPARASATVSLRLAPGQDPSAMRATLERLLRDGLPSEAEAEMSTHIAAPVLFDPGEEALALAAGAFRKACGVDPLFVRSGGSIPIVAEMAQRGYPVVVSGFGLPDDAMHGPDESYELQSLQWGYATAVELFRAFATLRS